MTEQASRNFKLSLAVLASATCMSLLLGEVVLRIVPDPKPPIYRNHSGDSMFELDTLLGWRSAPDSRYRVWSHEYDITVQNNALGFRGPMPREVTSECRILVVGDSFVQGLTVDYEDTFGQVAERTILDRSGRQCDVIAAGVEGYATDQELLWYRRDLFAYQPTLTVLFFFFNDVLCNTGTLACIDNLSRQFVFTAQEDSLVLRRAPDVIPETTRIADDRVPNPDEPSFGLRTRRWLAGHSELYRLSRRAARMVLGLDPRHGDGTLRSDLFNKPLPPRLSVFRTEYGAREERAWHLTESLVGALREDVESDRSRFALFLIPMRESVVTEQWAQAEAIQPLTGYAPRRIEERLSNYCANQSLQCIDPSDEFRAWHGADSSALYLRNDPHWTVIGHRRVGEILAAIVLEDLGRAAQ